MNCTSPVHTRSGQIYPCGKCPNCRARDRQIWVFRLRMEYQSCNFGLFVTMTYDDEHLPSDGVSKRDVQLFMKRLRKLLNVKYVNPYSRTCRYFIVSEYGDHTFRPHYHALLFFSVPRENDIYDMIEGAWQNGNIQFGEIEEGSIVYCTKYCLKGSDVPEGKNKNFRLVSKMNGGIGVNYLTAQARYHDPSRLENCRWQGFEAPMSRYYRSKLLDRYDDMTRTEICAAYERHLEVERDRLYRKKFSQFLTRHPDYRPEFDSDELRFNQWLKDCYDRKSELTLKRCKKQTKW